MLRFLFLISIVGQTLAQPLPYEAEIRAFERTDSLTPPPARPILFVGSSSIRFWSSLAADFPGKPVLNRGFGGSELSDVLHYADRIIVRYQPKQIVLYAGENDIATGHQTGRQTYERFVTLFQYVRQRLPNVPFVYISIKPSPARRQYGPEATEANRLISQFLTHQRSTRFVDVRPLMLQPNRPSSRGPSSRGPSSRGPSSPGPSSLGQPIGALFRPDSLHMNERGYQLWTQALRPYLK